jgi:hypothetical protein
MKNWETTGPALADGLLGASQPGKLGNQDRHGLGGGLLRWYGGAAGMGVSRCKASVRPARNRRPRQAARYAQPARSAIQFLAGCRGRNISPERLPPPWPALYFFAARSDSFSEEEVTGRRRGPATRSLPGYSSLMCFRAARDLNSAPSSNTRFDRK